MLHVTTTPETVYIEDAGWCQQLNCEFRVANAGELPMQLDAIQLSIFDGQGRLVWRRQVDRNAVVPSIQVSGATELGPGAELLVLNPFHTFPPDLPLDRLEFRFQLTAGDGDGEHELHVEVAPVRYQPPLALILPLAGRLWISDGHDFYGHHRRVDLAHPLVRQLGGRALSMRHAYDFVLVDERGAAYHGDQAQPEHWLGFGAPVLAPTDGVVVVAMDGCPDNRDGTVSSVPFDAEHRAQLLCGNQVALDHGGGAYSLLAHLQQGSVTVQIGERVRQGQVVGRLGNSGDSLFPHLHYDLSAAPDPLQAEGLPAAFRHFRRLRGAHAIEVEQGIPETGEIVESTVPLGDN